MNFGELNAKNLDLICFFMWPCLSFAFMYQFVWHSVYIFFMCYDILCFFTYTMNLILGEGDHLVAPVCAVCYPEILFRKKNDNIL